MFKKITNYCKESYDELVHKVSWPTRKELSSSAVHSLFFLWILPSSSSWKMLSIRTHKQLENV